VRDVIPKRVAAALAIVAVVSIACGDDPAPADGSPDDGGAAMSADLEDALADVKTTVDEVVDQVAPDLDRTPLDDNEEAVACDGAEGEFRSHFGYLIDAGAKEALATLHGAHAFLASEGFDVDTGGLEANPPSVLAEGDGFSYSVAVNEEDGVVIDGTTPCFPGA
jgi:hypothetical protein